jgi:hypothetical protein
MERNRKGLGAVIVLPIIIGLAELTQIQRNPRFEQIHTVDVVGLLGSGVCFGVAISGLAMLIRMKRNKS